MLKNYAVPVDVILRELKLNLSAEQYQVIGKSDVSEVSLERLISAVELEKKKEYSEERIERLIENLRYINSIKQLNEFKELKNNNVLSGEFSEIEKSILDVLFENKKSISAQFVEKIKENVLKNHLSVLTNKIQYQRVQFNCRNIVGARSAQGCIFKRLFKPLVSSELTDLQFSKSQIDRVWNELVRIVDSSPDNYFDYSEKALDQKLTAGVIKLITPINFFYSCVLKQNKKFKVINNSECRKVGISILQEYGFTSLGQKLESKIIHAIFFNQQFLGSSETFKYNVLKMNFQCLFNNKKCERRNYTKLLNNWRYGNLLSEQQINNLIEVLVKYHRRY